MTKLELKRAMQMVLASWPHAGSGWTPEAIEVWESLFLDLDYAQVLVAVQALAAEGREFAPPPGLIRRRAIELVSPIPDADQAWAEVRREIQRVGSLRGTVKFQFGEETVIEPHWSDPLIGEVADAMGWDALWQSENEIADRAHFIKMFRDAHERRRGVDHMPPAAKQLLDDLVRALPDKILALEA